jgi:hypothetical protein
MVRLITALLELVLDPLTVLLTLAATRDHGRAMSLENGTALPTIEN